MLTHSINLFKAEERMPPVNNRFVGTYHSDEHRKFIHARIMEYIIHSEGDHITYDGKLGVVCRICDDFAEVEWKHLQCLCVEVYLYETNDTIMCHPSDLRIR